MKKVSAPRIYTAPTEFLRNNVVEIHGCVVTSHYPLTHESAMTEWFQGVIVLSGLPADTITEKFVNISDFFTTPASSPLHAWHISDMDYQSGKIEGVSKCIVDVTSAF